MAEHVSSTMHVFGAKSTRYSGVARHKEPQRKGSKILPNGKCDRNGPLTVRHRSPDGRPRADTFWKEKRRRSSQPSTHSLP